MELTDNGRSANQVFLLANHGRYKTGGTVEYILLIILLIHLISSVDGGCVLGDKDCWISCWISVKDTCREKWKFLGKKFRRLKLFSI